MSFDTLFLFYQIVIVMLSLYGLHAGALVILGLRKRYRETLDEQPSIPPDDAPRVTVQIPVYNERYMVRRIIEAVTKLDYPREKLQVQVVDDSTDETCAIARQAIAEARADGLDIQWLHRDNREGFKAGALAAATPEATGEFIAVFDADFVPPPDFLSRLLLRRRLFDDPRVGFVQTCWRFLNRDDSSLTRSQALMMDLHFHVDKSGRNLHDLAINFNGSGGVWRRTCIDDAGGWQHDTLTEDLDLSYRAFMCGWTARYIPADPAPNDLPTDILAFKRQQRRWARGTAQCVRKLFPCLLLSKLTWMQKLFGMLHISGYFLHPFLLLFILLWPLVAVRAGATLDIPLWMHLLGPVCLTFVWGMFIAHRRQGRPTKAYWRDLPGAIMLGIGISFSNSMAVVHGLLGRKTGTFERTPKATAVDPAFETEDIDTAPTSYKLPMHWTIVPEALLALYTIVCTGVLIASGIFLFAIPMALYAGGFLIVVIAQLRLAFGADEPVALRASDQVIG